MTVKSGNLSTKTLICVFLQRGSVSVQVADSVHFSGKKSTASAILFGMASPTKSAAAIGANMRGRLCVCVERSLWSTGEDQPRQTTQHNPNGIDRREERTQDRPRIRSNANHQLRRWHVLRQERTHTAGGELRKLATKMCFQASEARSFGKLIRRRELSNLDIQSRQEVSLRRPFPLHQ